MDQVARRVEESFGRRLRPDWRTGLHQPNILLSATGRAAAVVAPIRASWGVIDWFRQASVRANGS